ncbi:HK97 family phage prohead protease [Brucepastera parasyntrophica]|uniref:HK97 family phage prohead protease n=1 Tax=Brucepastera parasyntrophica TaxID=2880008 RepID=UPI00210D4663|nr:HK97 family phage prohead protease [Brucepastera parasyntrophica]ULQ59230.1 HK97 family phage prohead protease [Brucepastera parasyntrophica]
MKGKQVLTFRNVDIRAEEKEGENYITGTIPYNSPSVDLGGFIERIAPTAFNKTMADNARVMALYNHDPSKVMGNTRSGTLTLESTETGLVCIAKVPDTTYGRDALITIGRGDVTTMSFAFTPIKVDTKPGEQILREVQLHEVSFGVTFPAYPETEAHTLKRAVIMAKRNIDLSVLEPILAKDSAELTDDEKRSSAMQLQP